MERLRAIHDPFLGIRLAFEVVATRGAPWAAYFLRRSDGLIPRASFGWREPVSLSAAALTAGSFQCNGERALAVELGRQHYFVIPETAPLSAAVIEELRRVVSISASASIAEGRHAVDPFPGADAILRFGELRKFPYASLFLLDASSVADRALARCPHSIPQSIYGELYDYIATAIGAIARAFIVRDGACLCAFYSHSCGDAELIATQITRTLARIMSLSDAELSAGPFASFKLTGDEAGAAIGTFIDGLE